MNGKDCSLEELKGGEIKGRNFNPIGHLDFQFFPYRSTSLMQFRKISEANLADRSHKGSQTITASNVLETFSGELALAVAQQFTALPSHSILICSIFILISTPQHKKTYIGMDKKMEFKQWNNSEE